MRARAVSVKTDLDGRWLTCVLCERVVMVTWTTAFFVQEKSTVFYLVFGSQNTDKNITLTDIFK